MFNTSLLKSLIIFSLYFSFCYTLTDEEFDKIKANYGQVKGEFHAPLNDLDPNFIDAFKDYDLFSTHLTSINEFIHISDPNSMLFSALYGIRSESGIKEENLSQKPVWVNMQVSTHPQFINKAKSAAKRMAIAESGTYPSEGDPKNGFVIGLPDDNSDRLNIQEFYELDILEFEIDNNQKVYVIVEVYEKEDHNLEFSLNFSENHDEKVLSVFKQMLSAGILLSQKQILDGNFELSGFGIKETGGEPYVMALMDKNSLADLSGNFKDEATLFDGKLRYNGEYLIPNKRSVQPPFEYLLNFEDDWYALGVALKKFMEKNELENESCTAVVNLLIEGDKSDPAKFSGSVKAGLEGISRRRRILV